MGTLLVALWGEKRMHWSHLEEGFSSCGGWWSLPFPSLQSLAVPWILPVLRAFTHPQLMLRAQGHLLTSQKCLALPALVPQAGPDGQGELLALPQ